MTTAMSGRALAERDLDGHYRFPDAARMEWVKLRSLRSTWLTLALTAAGATSIAAAVGANTKDGTADLTNNALAGISVGLLLIGSLGVLVMTGEYTSGAIRSTLAAIPNRPMLLAAKAAVFGATALAAGEAAALIAFFVGAATLPATIPAPTLADPAVLRAVLLAGAGISLIGLIGLGVGAIVRQTGPAVATLVGGVYVATQFLGAFAPSTLGYVPISIVANSLSTVQRLPYTLSPWAGVGLLCLYAAVLLGVGGALLARRDA